MNADIPTGGSTEVKGLHSMEAAKREFLALADRLASSTDAKERKRLKEELAAMTFGE